MCPYKYCSSLLGDGQLVLWCPSFAQLAHTSPLHANHILLAFCTFCCFHVFIYYGELLLMLKKYCKNSCRNWKLNIVSFKTICMYNVRMLTSVLLLPYFYLYLQLILQLLQNVNNIRGWVYRISKVGMCPGQ